jgi:DedD protein
LAQDDYYYEIQLTNKQLVFYFMAGATGLILSFLAGVMVGRGVDTQGGEVQAARPAVEERTITEETPKPASPATNPADLSYAQRLEADKADETIEKPKAVAAAATPGPVVVPTPSPKTVAAPPTPRPTPEARSKPAPTRPAAAPVASSSAGGTFAIQVGAFKDKGTADSVVSRLKGKGFQAFVVPAEGDDGLFLVRVGSYAARADAERTEAKLRDQEKFKPYIVKN